MRYFYLRHSTDNIRHCQARKAWRDLVLEIAGKSLDDTFIFTDKYEMERCTTPVTFTGTIDWDHVPYGDEEWCFALNRHTFLLKNAEAAVITGDERYRANWIRLFEDFYSRSKLSERTRGRSWRSLECGIRIENYIRSIEIFERAGMGLDEKTLSDIAAFLRAHADYLIETHTDFHRLSNWGVMQDHGLFLASLYLDDASGISTALSRLDDEAALQTLPDGMHWEQSSMYHAEVLHCLLDTLLVAGRNGIDVPERLRKNTHLLALGLARSLRPDGRCYLFGDSDEIDMRDMIAEAAVLFDDSELSCHAQGGCDEEFYLSHELDTRLPEPEAGRRSFFMRESGNAFLSLSDDTALRFHCGFLGSGHGHIDQLHFDLYHAGSVILTDTGRYTYTDSPERYALKGARGHNTLILGGREPSVMEDSWAVSSVAHPIFSDAITDGEFRYLSASHLGYADEGAFITRSIITISDRFIIIADDIRTQHPVKAERFCHFDTGTVLAEDGRLYRAVKDRAAIALSTLSGGDAEISAYPISKRYNELESAPLLTLCDEVDGRRCLLMLIAVGNKEFSVTRCPVLKALSGMELPAQIAQGLIIDDGSDSYSVAIVTKEYPKGGFLLRAGNAEAYGRVFIRKNEEETVILRY